jgi:hypothetical protein
MEAQATSAVAQGSTPKTLISAASAPVRTQKKIRVSTGRSKISPEVQLILWATRPSGQSRDLTQIDSLLEEDLDWEFILELGQRNGILPLLYWHLNSRFARRVPSEFLHQLQVFFRYTSVRNLLLVGELAQLLELFAKYGIEALPFKGPALALSLYGNLGLRTIRDLDVLVHERDLPAVKTLLAGKGYGPDPATQQDHSALDSDYCLSFKRQEGDMHVEIHWDVVPERLLRGPRIGYFWSRVRPSSLAGQPVIALPPDALLLLLCIHGHRHDWEELKWISDLGRMIESHSDMNWVSLLRCAETMRQEQAVLMGCSLSNLLLGVRPPDEIQRVLKEDPSVTARAGLLCGRILRPRPSLPGFSEWSAYLQLPELRDDESRRWMYLRYLSAIVAPESAERDSVPLPDWLFFLYYLYRPCRLLGRHGVPLFGRLK